MSNNISLNQNSVSNEEPINFQVNIIDFTNIPNKFFYNIFIFIINYY